MKVNIRSLTNATLTINSLGNYIIRGREVAFNVEISETQILELKVLERENLIKIEYIGVQVPIKEIAQPVKRGRGRPKGFNTKPVLIKEVESEIKKKDKKETSKITRNKTKAEAITDEMGSKVVVAVPGGVVERQMVHSVVGDAKESLKAEASIIAMEELEAEEAGLMVEDKQIINEESLDPSERMGGSAVISVGGDTKKVNLINSILPDADIIKNRNAFIDKEDSADFYLDEDDDSIEDVEKNDDDDDLFIEF